MLVNESVLDALTNSGEKTLSAQEVARVVVSDDSWPSLLVPIRRAAELVRNARDHAVTQVDTKSSETDVVTAADRASEQLVRDRLNAFATAVAPRRSRITPSRSREPRRGRGGFTSVTGRPGQPPTSR